MAEIRPHAVKCARIVKPADDGKYGLIGFEREKLDSAGSNALWIAVPISQLPLVAITAIQALPQPAKPEGDYPVVFDAEVVQFGSSALGELILSVELRDGVGISLQVTEPQADALLKGIQGALAKVRSDRTKQQKH
jgi:hypothetical protein